MTLDLVLRIQLKVKNSLHTPQEKLTEIMTYCICQNKSESKIYNKDNMC